MHPLPWRKRTWISITAADLSPPQLYSHLLTAHQAVERPAVQELQHPLHRLLQEWPKQLDSS